MLIDGTITPEKLPTSEKAICYHGFRLHLQIIKWKMLDEPQSLNATDWGWKKYGDYLVPIPTDKDVAPTNILKVIKCRCNSTSKNKCGTNLCSCKKNGLKFMSASEECHGEDLNNKKVSHLSILVWKSMDSVLYCIISFGWGEYLYFQLSFKYQFRVSFREITPQ